jgi:hypothetical protein
MHPAAPVHYQGMVFPFYRIRSLLPLEARQHVPDGEACCLSSRSPASPVHNFDLKNDFQLVSPPSSRGIML